MTRDQRTVKECKPCDSFPYPSPPWMGWDAKQDSYKRNSSESNGDLVNISRTRPLGAECLVFGVTFVFYAQGELAAIIWTIGHFTMRTWTRDTCGSELAEIGKTVFQGYLGMEDFRWSDHKPTPMEWRLERSDMSTHQSSLLAEIIFCKWYEHDSLKSTTRQNPRLRVQE